MLRAKECVVEMQNTEVCDFSAVAGHPRVAEMQMALNAGQMAVDFVCRDNVDGTLFLFTFVAIFNYAFAY